MPAHPLVPYPPVPPPTSVPCPILRSVSDLRSHLRLSRLHLRRPCPHFLESCSHSSPASPLPSCDIPCVCPVPILLSHPSHGPPLICMDRPRALATPPSPAFTLAAQLPVGFGVAGAVGLGKSDFGAWRRITRLVFGLCLLGQIRYLRVGAGRTWSGEACWRKRREPVLRDGPE